MTQIDNANKPERLFAEFPAVSTQEWEQLILADLKGADYEKKLIWKTPEGFDVKPYYRSEDIANLNEIHSLPGNFPFLRGNRKNHNQWEVRQDIAETDFDKANAIALRAISRGANSIGLNVKEVTKAADLKKLLRGINLTQTQLHFKSSISYSIFVAVLIDYLNSNNIDSKVLNGSINFDHYAYYLLHGEYYNSLQDNLNELRCLIDLIKEKLPNLHIINVNGKLYHNAGANTVQELAFTLSHALEYLSALTDMGMQASDVLPRLRFSMSLGGNYFFEIAKFRAARMLWAAISEQYVPGNESLQKVFIHAESSLWNKTTYDPYVNMLRTTTETMSGAIAGVDSINVLPFDVTYSETDEISQRIARNTQIILKEESYLDKVVDPAAGSYYVESLTHSLAKHAHALMLKIEEKGGFAKAMESGFIRQELEQMAAKRNIDIAMRRTSLLGTNQYPNLREQMLEKITHKAPEYSGYLTIYRGAQAFEELRLATEKHAAGGNKLPSVFLLTIGNLSMRKARASFATGFFGCAGYEIIDNLGFATPEDGVNAAMAAKADIVVICSSDEEYAEVGLKAAGLLKQSLPSAQIVIAGNPVELIESLKAAGVDSFIHVRTNVIDYLKECHNKLGISL